MNFQEFRKSLSEAKNEEGKPQTTKTFASATPGQPPVVFDVDPRYDGQKIAKELDPAGGIKHQMGHALSRQDNDVDGDVDAQDKHTPDEVVGTPDETQHMLKKNADERKHTKKGVAYESTQKEGVIDTADVKVTASGRRVRAHRIEVDKDEDDSMKEASMSDDQMKKREDIVKGMKKNFSDFVSRYGKDAKSVMYATATKNAMKEEVELEEVMGVDPISHKTYVKGGVPRSGRSVERHKFAITATVKGRGGREEKIEQESHARGTKDEAEAKLRDHFTNRLGYKISSMKHMGVVKEEVEAVAEGSEDVDLDEAAIKVGDTVVWNKGKTAQTVGVVHKIETDHYIVHHTRTNTYHKLPKQGSELVESVDLSEATDKTSQRLVQLVRFGLMDKSKLPLLTRAMASLDKGSVSNPSERQVLFELLDDLIGIVTGDDSTFSKIKMQVQK